MFGEILVGALQPWLVATGHDDVALELVAHDRGRDAAEEGEGAGRLAIQSGTCWVRVASA
jgi:hypothetical protein